MTAASAVAFVVTVAVFLLSRLAYLRLMMAAEATLRNMRVKVFDHICRLSLAEHTETRRGVLVSRVTSDIETLARFAQWGAISWAVNSALIIFIFVVLTWFAWQLALVTLLVFLTMVPALRFFQRRQLAAYDELRIAVGDTIGPLLKGPLSIMDVVAWCAATQGVATDGYSEGGLHAQTATGPQQVAWISQLVTDWMGDDGFLQRLNVEIFANPPLGSTTAMIALVADRSANTIMLNLTATDQHGAATAEGSATVILPPHDS